MQGIQLSLSLRFCYFLHFLEWFLGLSSKVTKYQIITPDQVSPDESKWNLFENPVGHPHHTKQSSGIIHSPFGSFDPLDQEIPTFEWEGAQLVLIYPIGRSTLSNLQILISRA